MTGPSDAKPLAFRVRQHWMGATDGPSCCPPEWQGTQEAACEAGAGRSPRPGWMAVLAPALEALFSTLSCCLSCLSPAVFASPSPIFHHHPAPRPCPASPELQVTPWGSCQGSALRLPTLAAPMRAPRSSALGLAWPGLASGRSFTTFLLSCPSTRAPASGGREAGRTVFPLFKVSRLVRGAPALSPSSPGGRQLGKGLSPAGLALTRGGDSGPLLWGGHLAWQKTLHMCACACAGVQVGCMLVCPCGCNIPLWSGAGDRQEGTRVPCGGADGSGPKGDAGQK